MHTWDEWEQGQMSEAIFVSAIAIHIKIANDNNNNNNNNGGFCVYR